MNSANNNYDFAFVLGGLPTSYPSGGEDIIFQLCCRLKSQGYNVALIIIKNARNYLYEIKKDPKLFLFNKRRRIIIRKIEYTSTFNKIGGWNILQRINNAGYDFSILKNIKTYFFKTPDEMKISIKRIIATSWVTADFTSEYVNNHSSTVGYYLVQNREDDPAFSGELSRYAANTYNLNNLRKIVISKDTYKTFENENPLFFNVGIDYQLFVYKPNLKENLIMFPLRKNESKGAKYVLEAAENLHKKVPNWKFLAFGDYPFQVPDYIEFHRNSKKQDILNLYSRSKIFILPSLVEGFPLTVLEAMSSGCAVVSTLCGGVDEYGVNDKNLLFVPIKNSMDIEKAVLTLIENGQLLEKLSRNARITVEKYSYDSMYKQFTSLFG